MVIDIEMKKKVQSKLKDLGLYKDNIDGLIGKNSLTAIRAFQRINGLPQTGAITQKFLDELFETDITELPEANETALTIATSNKWPNWPLENEAALTAYYGKVGTNQVMMNFPYPMKLAWDLRTTVTRTSCNVKCRDAFYYIFEETKKQYSWDEIVKHGLNLFGGCLNVRPIRGGTRYSTHAWGIAIDLDPARNQLKWGRDRAYLAKPELDKFWKIVDSTGCVSLGRKENRDWMHFQAAKR